MPPVFYQMIEEGSRLLQTKKHDKLLLWIVIPIVSLLVLITIFPMLYSLYVSFIDINLLKPHITFVSRKNLVQKMN